MDAKIIVRDEEPMSYTLHPALTKREYFAGLAMQGMWSNEIVLKHLKTGSPEEIAKMAIEQADALIKELNTPSTGTETTTKE